MQQTLNTSVYRSNANMDEEERVLVIAHRILTGILSVLSIGNLVSHFQ